MTAPIRTPARRLHPVAAGLITAAAGFVGLVAVEAFVAWGAASGWRTLAIAAGFALWACWWALPEIGRALDDIDAREEGR